jgi:hypothetical protein
MEAVLNTLTEPELQDAMVMPAEPPNTLNKLKN